MYYLWVIELLGQLNHVSGERESSRYKIARWLIRFLRFLNEGPKER